MEELRTDELVEERCEGCGARLYRWEVEEMDRCRRGRLCCLACRLSGRCGCREEVASAEAEWR